ncbi:hypothetical protein Ani05nite_12100 [Amorphoplanes nipponensis]|uniref:Uncharacterized protein n=1 Tax=Actinoplanes nipponensis TaxID=135950 RepID=A0A919MJP5_9ACTN|nr:hypothetical protein [Actinoplanes nipponensis]GIE47676.1 hypothetical protein Ani05nite_12100 [Actinoplanes nipponensis]
MPKNTRSPLSGGARRPASGRRMFWLSAATTVTVLGGGYAAGAAWAPAADAGSMVLNTVFLPTGHRPVAVAGDAGVTVAWRASEGAEDLPALTYVVMRHGDGGATEACVVTTTTCPDLGVPAGTWRYTVRPDLGRWQGRDGPPGIPVTVPAPAVQVIGERPGLLERAPAGRSAGDPRSGDRVPGAG